MAFIPDLCLRPSPLKQACTDWSSHPECCTKGGMVARWHSCCHRAALWIRIPASFPCYLRFIRRCCLHNYFALKPSATATSLAICQKIFSFCFGWFVKLSSRWAAKSSTMTPVRRTRCSGVLCYFYTKAAQAASGQDLGSRG